VRPSIHGVRRTPFMDGLPPPPTPSPKGEGALRRGCAPPPPKGATLRSPPFTPRRRKQAHAVPAGESMCTLYLQEDALTPSPKTQASPFTMTLNPYTTTHKHD